MRHIVRAIFLNSPPLLGVIGVSVWLRNTLSPDDWRFYGDLGAALLAGFLIGHDTRSGKAEEEKRAAARKEAAMREQWGSQASGYQDQDQAFTAS